MKIPFLDLARQNRRQLHELSQIFEETLLHDRLSGGTAVSDFEEAFANYLDTNYCVSCGNGTDALEIILRALNISSGDEVIVPTNGWLSAAEMVKLVGAQAIFVDLDQESYNISPQQIQAAITAKTKAIIPIHLYGQAADMPTIMEIATQQGLYVIEDCAQAHGASIYGKKVGTWGHAAAFSFYPTKNLGAIGDAGAIITADEALAQQCRQVANHGADSLNNHKRLGRNSRMDSLQAAVLNFRLNQLDAQNNRRRYLAGLYRAQLQDLPIALPQETAGSFHVYHLFVIRTRQRDALRTYLAEKGIGTLVHYPVAVCDMAHLNPGRMPVASQQSHELLSLPLYPEMTDEEVMEVCRAIRMFFE